MVEGLTGQVKGKGFKGLIKQTYWSKNNTCDNNTYDKTLLTMKMQRQNKCTTAAGRDKKVNSTHSKEMVSRLLAAAA